MCILPYSSCLFCIQFWAFECPFFLLATTTSCCVQEWAVCHRQSCKLLHSWLLHPGLSVSCLPSFKGQVPDCSFLSVCCFPSPLPLPMGLSLTEHCQSVPIAAAAPCRMIHTAKYLLSYCEAPPAVLILSLVEKHCYSLCDQPRKLPAAAVKISQVFFYPCLACIYK